jgi:ATP-binding cassette subfamily C (CFTR/MRP) protein 1
MKDLRLDTPPPPSGQAIDFSVPKSSVCMISGPMGCGKSTLLRTILGEKMPKGATIHLQTPYVGYCGQIPWIQNCSIKQNIIGFHEPDESWYSNIIYVSDLEADFPQMLECDKTEVGSRGLSLSGGQKHRLVSVYGFYSHSLTVTGLGKGVVFKVSYTGS